MIPTGKKYFVDDVYEYVFKNSCLKRLFNMKILVPTKIVPDPDQPIRLDPSGRALDLKGIPCIINPFDAIAIEEALRIRDEQRMGHGDVEVVSVGIASKSFEKDLRIALAMGVDRLIHVVTEAYVDSWAASLILKAVTEKENPDMILMGKQAIDTDGNQTGQFLAAHLEWPQATFASQIKFDNSQVIVNRETDLGIEVVSMQLPCLVTADLRLNEPRYASLPAIMKAKRREIDTISPDELGAAIESKVEVLSMETVSSKRHCVRVRSVTELVQKLKENGVLN